jgi:DNA replication and repair protein RecF
MRLEWVSLTDFRAHRSVRFEPDPGVNVLVGPNGSGKTSLLEAIGYLVMLRSFRGAPDASLVTVGSETSVVRGGFAGERREVTVEVEIPFQGRRRVRVGGKPVRSRADIAEGVTLVAFLPDDLDLVKRGPAMRREFIDDACVQLWPSSAVEQREFDRSLRQRNALLRTEGRYASDAALDALDELVASRAADVLARRLAAMSLLGEAVGQVYRQLSDAAEDLSWAYDSSGAVASGTASRDELAEGTLDRMRAARGLDKDRRTTTIGPHRDELTLTVGDRDARTRASQGEQRSIALALRVALYRALADRREEAPILLLDDVFSELDPDRSDRLVQQLPGGQVFVTSARAEEVPLVGRRWSVLPGEVRADD